MSVAVGDTIRERLEEISREAKDTEKQIEALKASIKPLTDERKTLEKSLALIEGVSGSSNGASSGAEVADADLIKTLEHAGEALKTPEIAELLGVKSNKIARKLKKLADEGQIGGDKETGFVALVSGASNAGNASEQE